MTAMKMPITYDTCEQLGNTKFMNLMRTRRCKKRMPVCCVADEFTTHVEICIFPNLQFMTIPRLAKARPGRASQYTLLLKWHGSRFHAIQSFEKKIF